MYLIAIICELWLLLLVVNKSINCTTLVKIVCTFTCFKSRYNRKDRHNWSTLKLGLLFIKLSFSLKFLWLTLTVLSHKTSPVAWCATPNPNPVWWIHARSQTRLPVSLPLCCWKLCVSWVIPAVRTCWETPSQILLLDISSDRINWKYRWAYGCFVTRKQGWISKPTVSCLIP